MVHQHATPAILGDDHFCSVEFNALTKTPSLIFTSERGWAFMLVYKLRLTGIIFNYKRGGIAGNIFAVLSVGSFANLALRL